MIMQLVNMQNISLKATDYIIKMSYMHCSSTKLSGSTILVISIHHFNYLKNNNISLSQKETIIIHASIKTSMKVTFTDLN